jgi:hypothetical protein
LPKKKKFLLLPSLLELSWGGQRKKQKGLYRAEKNKEYAVQSKHGYVRTYILLKICESNHYQEWETHA